MWCMQDGASNQEPKTAVALSYDRQSDAAPKIAAKGTGYIAEQIIAIAKAHDIAIKEEPDLVAILSGLEIDTPIPLEAYSAVAAILTYIYKTNATLKAERGSNDTKS